MEESSNTKFCVELKLHSLELPLLLCMHFVCPYAAATCLCSFACLQAAVVVRGDYRVVADLSSYANPTERCEECGVDRGLGQTCCDATRNNSCTGNARCDNKFYYCLRELGAEGVESDPLDCNPLVTTETNRNGETIEFNQSTVLGLPNPLSLTGLAPQWEVSAGSEVTTGGVACGVY